MKFAEKVAIVVVFLLYLAFIWFIFSFPEIIAPRLANSLKRDIEQGNREAIEYYQTNYVERGITLWD